MIMRKIIFLLSLVTCGFTLGGCCDEDFITSNDFKGFAFDVGVFMDGCSKPQAFTTKGATPDESVGACWFNTDPLHNVWFKFKATNTGAISIEIQVALQFDTETGTQRNTFATLVDGEGNEIDCEIHYSDNDIVYLNSGDLIEGETYFISVDVENTESAGTFTVCIYDDPS